MNPKLKLYELKLYVNFLKTKLSKEICEDLMVK